MRRRCVSIPEKTASRLPKCTFPVALLKELHEILQHHARKNTDDPTPSSRPQVQGDSLFWSIPGLFHTIMHRLNDILTIPHQYIPFPPSSVWYGEVHHAIVIPPHVLNIITIMNTLNIMSLYLNVLSPHRATTLTKIPSPRRRDFCVCMGAMLWRIFAYRVRTIVAIKAQMVSLPSVTISRSRESSPEAAGGTVRRTAVAPGCPPEGVNVNPGTAPASKYHS